MPGLDRYCKACEEFYTVSEEKADLDDLMHGCGEDGVPADRSGVKSDGQIYAEENPLSVPGAQ